MKKQTLNDKKIEEGSFAPAYPDGTLVNDMFYAEDVKQFIKDLKEIIKKKINVKDNFWFYGEINKLAGKELIEEAKK